jgi:serine protease Do
VGFSPPGTAAKLKVWRDQNERTVELKVGEAPEEREGRAPGVKPTRSVLGLEVRPMTPELAKQLNLKTADGVVVVRVEDGGPAAEAGIQRGDVVREINRKRVQSMADFERLTKDVKEGDRLTLLLQRGQMSLYVAFTATK